MQCVSVAQGRLNDLFIAVVHIIMVLHVRYPNTPSCQACVQSLSSFKRREQGLNFLEEGKSLAKKSDGQLTLGLEGTTLIGSHGQPVDTQHLSSTLLSINHMGSVSMVCVLLVVMQHTTALSFAPTMLVLFAFGVSCRA